MRNRALAGGAVVLAATFAAASPSAAKVMTGSCAAGSIIPYCFGANFDVSGRFLRGLRGHREEGRRCVSRVKPTTVTVASADPSLPIVWVAEFVDRTLIRQSSTGTLHAKVPIRSVPMGTRHTVRLFALDSSGAKSQQVIPFRRCGTATPPTSR
jgi:hypothetical protein